MAGRDCHGTWKYWPASGPVSLVERFKNLREGIIKRRFECILYVWICAYKYVPFSPTIWKRKDRVGPPTVLVAVEFNWECTTKIGGGPTRFFDVFLSIYFFVDISKNRA